MFVPTTVLQRACLKQNQTLVLTPLKTPYLIVIITTIVLSILCLITCGAPLYYNPSFLDELYYKLFHYKQLQLIQTNATSLRSMMSIKNVEPLLRQLGWSGTTEQIQPLISKKLKSSTERLNKIMRIFSQTIHQSCAIKPYTGPLQNCPCIDIQTIKEKSFIFCRATCQGAPSYMEDLIFNGSFDLTINQVKEHVSGFVLMDGHAPDSIRATITNPINKYTEQNFFKILERYLGAYLQKGYSLSGVYEAFKATFKSLHQSYPSKDSGSTFIGIFLINHLLFCVSIGDSKAFLMEHQVCTPLNLSADPLHPYFAKKLKKQEATVSSDGRVGGRLNMATSLGDKGITGIKPSMSFTLIPRVWTKPSNYLVLGSDGIFDHVSKKDLEKILKEPHSLDQKTKTLIQKAFNNGSQDNLSAVIMLL